MRERDDFNKKAHSLVKRDMRQETEAAMESWIDRGSSVGGGGEAGAGSRQSQGEGEEGFMAQDQQQHTQ